jgi:oligopeptide/dipeptide ABC transporter ATP-binding protein
VALLSAVPNPDPRIRKKRLVLQGDVPSPANPPSGCRFHTRCWLRTRLNNPEDCETIEPQLRPIAGDHMVACHYAEQITDSMVGELVPIAKRGTAAVPYRSAAAQPQEAPGAAPSPDDGAPAGV